jgi:four helix bundle suffix protein
MPTRTNSNHAPLMTGVEPAAHGITGNAVWDRETRRIRKLAYAKNRSYKTYKSYIEDAIPQTAANTIICVIHQTNYLLDQQLRQLERRFLEHGGFTERLYNTRQSARRKENSD